jgi:hypothetical protein
MRHVRKFNENFTLTDKMKDVIDLEKRYHPTAFNYEEADELERDIDSSSFIDDVFDQISDDLPDNYDYYEVVNAINNYANR